MAIEIGEARETWSKNVWDMVQDFADKMKSEEPFYVVFACKPDTSKQGVFRQAIKAYSQRPPAILGILVWYVNKRTSEFRFCPELSAPPDIPLDPSLLSDKASDAFESVAHQGKKMNVLVS